MDIEKVLESVHSAKINLENMVKMMPTLGAHPLLPLVRVQLMQAIAEIENDEEDS